LKPVLPRRRKEEEDPARGDRWRRGPINERLHMKKRKRMWCWGDRRRRRRIHELDKVVG
jgi:hypothetical protein